MINTLVSPELVVAGFRSYPTPTLGGAAFPALAKALAQA
jgi:hypothetical protein